MIPTTGYGTGVVIFDARGVAVFDSTSPVPGRAIRPLEQIGAALHVQVIHRFTKRVVRLTEVDVLVCGDPVGGGSVSLENCDRH